MKRRYSEKRKGRQQYIQYIFHWNVFITLFIKLLPKGQVVQNYLFMELLIIIIIQQRDFLLCLQKKYYNSFWYFKFKYQSPLNYLKLIVNDSISRKTTLKDTTYYRSVRMSNIFTWSDIGVSSLFSYLNIRRYSKATLSV